MTSANEELIGAFFQAYAARDLDALRRVLVEEFTWTFPGSHPLAGVKTGVDAVIAFFDVMGAVMGASGVRNEQLVSGTSDDYVIQCQHISTDRQDGVNLDQELCVLWQFRDGKIAAGRHFAADERALNEFFNGAMAGGSEGNQTTDTHT